MIHTSLSPNTEFDDLTLSFSSLILPWRWFSWREGRYTHDLELAFRTSLDVGHAISFYRGTDALFVLLKAIGIGSGDEVILQAYTCVVVPNAIQYTGARPVFVDIEEGGYNIDPELIEKAITEKTKAVIIQHTFGEPANIEAIQDICKRYKVLLIEDCAHALSGRFQGRKLGTFGDAAIWSFGRDKIISSVWGGMVTTADEQIARKVQRIHDVLKAPGFLQVFQALLHPLVFALIKPIYTWKLGRGILFLIQKLHLIPKVILPIEKKGKKAARTPQKMANALARLAIHQLKKLYRFQQHRKGLAEFYTKALKDIPGLQLPHPGLQADPAWLRYTIRTPKAYQILKKAQRAGIYLGDWYRSVLAPEDCDPADFQYVMGTCPRAERAARETLNLPTHIQMMKAKAEGVVGVVTSLL